MFSTSINQAIPFLMLPILTIFLLPKDFGYINNFSAILVLSNAIIGGGMTANIAKNYFTMDKIFMKKMMGNLYFFLSIVTIFAFLVVLIVNLFCNITFIPPKLFIIIPFISFFFISFEFLKETLKIRKQVGNYALFTFSEMILNISFSLILVVLLLWNWKGRVYSIIFSYLIFGIFSIIYFIKKDSIKFSIDINILKKILNLSLPLLSSTISIMVMRKSGVLFIDSFFGKTEAGLYGIALNISTIILFISMPFINIWMPYIYKKLANKNQNTFLALRSNLFLFTCLIFFASIVFSLISGSIIRIMTTEAFMPAKVFIPWLAFGFALWALYSMYMPFFIHYGKQKFLSIITIVSALSNILANFFLISVIGAKGIAISFFLSNFLTYALVFISVRSFVKLPVFPDMKMMRLTIKGFVK